MNAFEELWIGIILSLVLAYIYAYLLTKETKKDKG